MKLSGSGVQRERRGAPAKKLSGSRTIALPIAQAEAQGFSNYRPLKNNKWLQVIYIILKIMLRISCYKNKIIYINYCVQKANASLN